MGKLDINELEDVAGGRISSEAACQKALKYIGLNKYRVTLKKNVLVTDEGTPKYDIVFTSAGVTYEFYINADTGNVMGYTAN